MTVEEEKTPLACSIYDNLPTLDIWYCPLKNKSQIEGQDCLQKLIRRPKNSKNVSFCNNPPSITYYYALDEKMLDYAPSGCCGGSLSGTSQ